MTTEQHSPEWLIENADHGIAFEVACASALTRLLAENAELQKQLEAIGAGGVGQLMAHEHVRQPAAAMLTVSERAVERDELQQVALNFIETLTGMQPPPIEIAPPEVFAPFRDFVDRIQAVTDRRNSTLRKHKPPADQQIAYAKRYEWLRSRNLDAISSGGVFAGMMPENVVLNDVDLDAAIDAAMERAHGIRGAA
jgi:hypothetical protein